MNRVFFRTADAVTFFQKKVRQSNGYLRIDYSFLYVTTFVQQKHFYKTALLQISAKIYQISAQTYQIINVAFGYQSISINLLMK